MTTTDTPRSAPRLDLPGLAPAAYEAMLGLDGAARGELDARTVALVQIRASQLNGCTFCLDLHGRQALAAGERAERLAALADWRTADGFTDRERAALNLTESVTLVADRGLGDAIWRAAADHFDERELAHLLWVVAAINAWNRVAIATRLTG